MQVGGTGEAHDVLAECHRHYATLHASEPGRYVVALCDVLLRVALAFVMEGRYHEAERQARQALNSYAEADADDALEREFGKLRAHTLVGRALLLGGRPSDALVEFDAALFLGSSSARTPALTAPTSSGSHRHPRASGWRRRSGWAPRWPRWSCTTPWAGGPSPLMPPTSRCTSPAGWRRSATTPRTSVRGHPSRAQTIWWSAEHVVQPLQSAPARSGKHCGGGHLVMGPHLQPDLTRISRLAAWGDPPTS